MRNGHFFRCQWQLHSYLKWCEDLFCSYTAPLFLSILTHFYFPISFPAEIITVSVSSCYWLQALAAPSCFSYIRISQSKRWILSDLLCTPEGIYTTRYSVTHFIEQSRGRVSQMCRMFMYFDIQTVQTSSDSDDTSSLRQIHQKRGGDMTEKTWWKSWKEEMIRQQSM